VSHGSSPPSLSRTASHAQESEIVLFVWSELIEWHATAAFSVQLFNVWSIIVIVRKRTIVDFAVGPCCLNLKKRDSWYRHLGISEASYGSYGRGELLFLGSLMESCLGRLEHSDLVFGFSSIAQNSNFY
jgi:hypothetical protein